MYSILEIPKFVPILRRFLLMKVENPTEFWKLFQGLKEFCWVANLILNFHQLVVPQVPHIVLAAVNPT